MTEDSKRDGSEAALWARARAAWQEAAAPAEAPGALTLAAYLDDRLEAPARARVEAWMAGSTDALDLVIAAWEARAAAPAPVSGGLLGRAEGLVRQPPAAARPAIAARLAESLAAPAALARPAGWAGIAAAVLLASVIGFELGRTGSVEMAALDELLAEELSLGLAGPADDLL
ncbi:MAG: hypothetical protein ACE5KF_03990 [Kiloniellaceae bacterium]